MAKFKKRGGAKRQKKYSTGQVRAYWVGYGIGLANKDSITKGGEKLNRVGGAIGYAPSVDAARAGFEKAYSDSAYKAMGNFEPKRK